MGNFGRGFMMGFASAFQQAQAAAYQAMAEKWAEKRRLDAEKRAWRRQLKMHELREESTKKAEKRSEERWWKHFKAMKTRQEEAQGRTFKQQQEQAILQGNIQSALQEQSSIYRLDLAKKEHEWEMKKLGLKTMAERQKDLAKQEIVTPVMDTTSMIMDLGPYGRLQDAEARKTVRKMVPFTRLLEEMYDLQKEGGTINLGVDVENQKPISFFFDPDKSLLDNFYELAAIGRSRRFAGGEMFFGDYGAIRNIGKTGGWLNEVLPSGVTQQMAYNAVKNYAKYRQLQEAKKEPTKNALPAEADRSAPKKDRTAGWNFDFDETKKSTPELDDRIRTPKIPKTVPSTRDWNEKLGAYPHWGIGEGPLANAKQRALFQTVKDLKTQLQGKANFLEVAQRWSKTIQKQFPDTLAPYFEGLTDKQLTSRIRYLLGEAQHSRTPFTKGVQKFLTPPTEKEKQRQRMGEKLYKKYTNPAYILSLPK